SYVSGISRTSLTNSLNACDLVSQVGSNPTPATMKNCRSDLLYALLDARIERAVPKTVGDNGVPRFLQVSQPGSRRAGVRCLRHGEYPERFQARRTLGNVGDCRGLSAVAVDWAADQMVIVSWSKACR